MMLMQTTHTYSLHVWPTFPTLQALNVYGTGRTGRREEGKGELVLSLYGVGALGWRVWLEAERTIPHRLAKHSLRPEASVPPCSLSQEESQAPPQTYQNGNLCITGVPKRFLSTLKFKKQAKCSLQPLNKNL